MPRYRLTVEYAGTRYSGWQVQKNARTVQGALYDAVHAATGREALEIYGAGRTDAGVHALAQVAHLDLGSAVDPRTLVRGLNDALPSDIVVTGCERTTPRFHARHSAVARWYLYQVALRKTALAKPFVWWVKQDLDAGRMRRAADRLTGRHDFRSFAHRGDEEDSTLVEIEAVQVEAVGDLVLVRVAGSHFLWRMVRRLIGVLVAVGTGELAPSVIDGLLRQDSTLPATLTAPASGLFLERVLYPGEETAPGPLRPVVRLG